MWLDSWNLGINRQRYEIRPVGRLGIEIVQLLGYLLMDFDFEFVIELKFLTHVSHPELPHRGPAEFA